LTRNFVEASIENIACNPSFSGGRDKEECSSKPALGNSSQDPIWKIANTKNRGDGVAQVVEDLPSKPEALSSATLPHPTKKI
jgi:hypothetical protein